MTLSRLKELPRDVNLKVCSVGSENITFQKTTTTGWDEVVLPDGVECKNAIIKVRSTDNATAVAEDDIKFLFSSQADGTGGFPSNGIGTGTGKVSGTLGYVYTGTASQLIVVIVVA